MLEISKKTISVKFNDKVYDLNKCSAFEAKEMFKKMKKIDQEKEVDKLMELQWDLLEKSGAPQEMLEALDLEQFGLLTNEIMGVKKT